MSARVPCKACKRPMRVVCIWIPAGTPKPIIGYACRCGGYAETDQYGKTVYGPDLKLERGSSPVHYAIWLDLSMFGKCP